MLESDRTPVLLLHNFFVYFKAWVLHAVKSCFNYFV